MAGDCKRLMNNDFFIYQSSSEPSDPASASRNNSASWRASSASRLRAALSFAASAPATRMAAPKPMAKPTSVSVSALAKVRAGAETPGVAPIATGAISHVSTTSSDVRTIIGTVRDENTGAIRSTPPRITLPTTAAPPVTPANAAEGRHVEIVMPDGVETVRVAGRRIRIAPPAGDQAWATITGEGPMLLHALSIRVERDGKPPVEATAPLPPTFVNAGFGDVEL